MKDISIRVRMDAIEWARLNAVAGRLGVNLSSAIRILIKERADAFASTDVLAAAKAKDA